MSLIAKILGLAPRQPPLSLSDANFASQVLKSELPVLVDVWGADCGPCKQLEAVIMELAARYAGRLKVGELNVQRAPLTTARLRIQATPTVLYFEAGVELERVAGFRSSLFHAQTIRELFGIEA